MGNRQQIRTALETALFNANLFGVGNNARIATENNAYVPTAGTSYARCTLMPAEPELIELGVNAQIKQIGLFQVDIFTPLNSGGPVAGDVLADTVEGLYKTGTDLMSTDRTVVVSTLKSWSLPGRDDTAKGWRIDTVKVRYYSYVTNS